MQCYKGEKQRLFGLVLLFGSCFGCALRAFASKPFVRPLYPQLLISAHILHKGRRGQVNLDLFSFPGSCVESACSTTINQTYDINSASLDK